VVITEISAQLQPNREERVHSNGTNDAIGHDERNEALNKPKEYQMKKRTALVSYSNCHISAYQVKQAGFTTVLVAAGDAYAPQEKGVTVATVKEEDGGLSVTIPNGSEFSTIRLSAVETERLLTALIAHQQLREGFNVEFYKKG
jgi:hypothetical protein